ncbi:MAG: type II secretion system protein GspD, partial [Methylocystis sp.]|nr:type II secretion system protein GspD [Methylocystis sp.]
SGGGGFGSGGQGQQSGPQSVALGDDARFRVAVDEAKNAIVIMSSPDDYRRLERIIQALDVLPNQVYIEATIAEVALNDQLNFGVAWYLENKASSAGFTSANALGTPTLVTDYGQVKLGQNLLGIPLGAGAPGFSYALRLFGAQATLRALNQITDVNIISTPSLTVLDNRQAFLQVGNQVPVQGGTLIGVGQSVANINYLSTGVILQITPHISESGRVMLELQQQVSNVDPNTAPGSLTPTIQQRTVATQVVVNDSESLMLGGLIRDARSRGARQLPVAGDLPVVGNLFKDKLDTVDKTELVIMITPHVVRSLSEAREITDEYKRKLLQISTKAIARPHDINQSIRRTLLDPWSVSPSRLDSHSR